MSERTDEKINDLQLAVAKMRQQQEELQKKLKLEHDKKEKLEVDISVLHAVLFVIFYLLLLDTR